MATEEHSVEDIETMVMGIREHIMEYFKGGCVERLTSNNIESSRIPRPTEFQYQRRLIELQNPRRYRLNGLPLFDVQREQDQITFNVNVFNRSPQMKQVYAQLIKFMENYLGGVEVKTATDKVVYAE